MKALARAGVKAENIKAAPLKVPEPPPRIVHLVYIFEKLSGQRQPAQGVMAPISESEIYYYKRNREIDLRPWEADALLSIDLSYRTVMNREIARRMKQKPEPGGPKNKKRTKT